MDGQRDGSCADRQGADSGGVQYRPDDVLKLECPFTETTVTDVSRFYVSVPSVPGEQPAAACNAYLDKVNSLLCAAQDEHEVATQDEHVRG
ncbi:hypothetical protein [Streptomyces sp. NPDC047079]|uniref:hypothetical protein n=1 Tax=Streptomyces sp. NPDC047079 TaxID=3154607 RepID=UPI0033D9606A